MPYQHKANETLYRGRSRWLRVPDNYEAKPGEDVIDTDDVIKKVDLEQGLVVVDLLEGLDD